MAYRKYAPSMMFTPGYQQGRYYGCAGEDGYGFVAAAALAPVIGGVLTGVVAPIVGLVQQGKQNKHDIAMSEEERKTIRTQTALAAQEARAAEANAAAAAAGTANAAWYGGSFMLVGLAAVLAYTLLAPDKTTKKKKKKEQA